MRVRTMNNVLPLRLASGAAWLCKLSTFFERKAISFGHTSTQKIRTEMCYGISSSERVNFKGDLEFSAESLDCYPLIDRISCSAEAVRVVHSSFAAHIYSKKIYRIHWIDTQVALESLIVPCSRGSVISNAILDLSASLGPSLISIDPRVFSSVREKEARELKRLKVSLR
jgi:hypothetical protein